MKRPLRFSFAHRLIAMVMVTWQARMQALGRSAIVLIITLVLLPMVVYVLVEVLRKPSTFHIAADTEVLDMVTTGVSATRWYIQQAEAVLGDADPLGEGVMDSYAFSGLVEIGPRSNVRMLRYGNGPLLITLLEDESGESLEALFETQNDAPQEEVTQGEKERTRAIPVVTLENLVNEDATWHWADSASLQVHIGDTPFSGSLLAVGAIGSETYAASVGEAPPVLRSGRVVVMEKRLFSDLRYPVMELDLQLGDEVWVADVNGHPADTACVFSAAGQDARGIDVACHATGKTLKVSRFGGHLVEMEPGPWDMVLAEPTLQAMVPVLFSAIYLLLQVLIRFVFPRSAPAAHG